MTDLPLSRDQIAAIQARAADGRDNRAPFIAFALSIIPALCRQALRAIELEAERDRALAIAEGEKEARWKSDAALRSKDDAVSQLMALCQRNGIDISGLIP